MDSSTALFALAVAVVGHGVLWFFKTPKESAGELASRVTAMEVMVQNLAVRFAGMDGKLGIQITTLSDNIKELGSNVRELTRRMDNHRVGS